MLTLDEARPVYQIKMPRFVVEQSYLSIEDLLGLEMRKIASRDDAFAAIMNTEGFDIRSHRDGCHDYIFLLRPRNTRGAVYTHNPWVDGVFLSESTKKLTSDEFTIVMQKGHWSVEEDNSLSSIVKERRASAAFVL